MGLLEDKRRARVFYRFLSPVYDWINPFIWTTEMRSRAISYLDLSADDRALDVGCGTGFGTEGLLEYTTDVYGIDQSSAQLSRAREKLGRFDPVTFCLGDAERLPFADDTFDVVWSSGAIEYWPHPVETLRELRRVCVPGGQVLVVGPHEPSSTPLRWLADAIMLFYDEAEAEQMFSTAGFTDIEHHLLGPAYRPNIAITTIARVPT